MQTIDAVPTTTTHLARHFALRDVIEYRLTHCERPRADVAVFVWSTGHVDVCARSGIAAAERRPENLPVDAVPCVVFCEGDCAIVWHAPVRSKAS